MNGRQGGGNVPEMDVSLRDVEGDWEGSGHGSFKQGRGPVSNSPRPTPVSIDAPPTTLYRIARQPVQHTPQLLKMIPQVLERAPTSF